MTEPKYDAKKKTNETMASRENSLSIKVDALKFGGSQSLLRLPTEFHFQVFV